MWINERVKIRDLKRTDLHMHTIYCDGRNTPEEMVQAAIRKNMECIGFSGHSYVPFDPEAGMNRQQEEEYCLEIAGLRQKYRHQIRIFCGMEVDYHSPARPKESMPDLDYRIGSVHYLRTSHGYAAIDDTPEILLEAVASSYHHDFYLAAEEYFRTVSDIISVTGADIIGHFDLISKFNETCHMFDETHPRYVEAWKKALDLLIPQNRVFEINTGAMARGYRSVPYPNPDMIRYIRERGGRFILSGDSHQAENIGYAFDTMEGG